MMHTFFWMLLLIYGIYCTSATLTWKNSETNATYIMPNTDPVKTLIEGVIEKKTLGFKENCNRLEAKVNELMVNKNALENKILQLSENANRFETKVNELMVNENRHENKTFQLTKDNYKLEAKIDELMIKIRDLQKPRSCQEVGNDGIYKIFPDFGMKNGVLCHRGHGTYKGVWTVVAQRFDSSVNFNRNWSDYKHGFGNLNGEFFIGLEPLHAMTTGNVKQQLLIILKDWINLEVYANYETFAIGNELEDYALMDLGLHTGNTSNIMGNFIRKKFSTFDRHTEPTNFNCARHTGGGWWFNGCRDSHLFGARKNNWIELGGSSFLVLPLQHFQMLIKPSF